MKELTQPTLTLPMLATTRFHDIDECCARTVSNYTEEV